MVYISYPPYPNILFILILASYSIGLKYFTT